MRYFKIYPLIKDQNVKFEEVTIDLKPKDISKMFKCSFCPSKFSSRTGVYQHVKKEHNGRRFKCSKCGLYYVLRRTCSEHVKKVHGDQKVKIEEITVDVKEENIKLLKKNELEIRNGYYIYAY